MNYLAAYQRWGESPLPFVIVPFRSLLGLKGPFSMLENQAPYPRLPKEPLAYPVLCLKSLLSAALGARLAPGRYWAMWVRSPPALLGVLRLPGPPRGTQLPAVHFCSLRVDLHLGGGCHGAG